MSESFYVLGCEGSDIVFGVSCCCNFQQAAAVLTEVEQSPSPQTVAEMKPCTDALVLPGLLRHKDKDVRLLVATCVSEIMRIVAPEAPYEDDVLKVRIIPNPKKYRCECFFDDNRIRSLLPAPVCYYVSHGVRHVSLLTRRLFSFLFLFRISFT